MVIYTVFYDCDDSQNFLLVYWPLTQTICRNLKTKMHLRNKTIWTYWEDKPGSMPPPHISLCRDILTYQCKKCTIQLVTPENVKIFLPELNPDVWKISMIDPKKNPIAVRCAFIRAFLLEKYGGLYVDSDCIALKDFACIFDLMWAISKKKESFNIG